MTLPTPIDPNQFKATQREVWSAVAGGWKKWWLQFEAGAQPVNERLVALARVKPGMRVLDVATGIGEPALTAARAVGPKGSVLGTDLAPPMIALAGERAREAKVTHIEFREMDAEKLELEPASFDAALSRWGIMLMLDSLAALRGIHRALKPGARLAVAVWGVAETVPFIAIPAQAAIRELGAPPPPAGSPGPFALGKPGDLEALLERAGFSGISVEVMSATMDFDSPALYCEYVQDLSGSFRSALAGQTEEVRRRTLQAVEREARRHAGADGRIHFVNQVRCASAAR